MTSPIKATIAQSRSRILRASFLPPSTRPQSIPGLAARLHRAIDPGSSRKRRALVALALLCNVCVTACSHNGSQGADNSIVASLSSPSPISAYVRKTMSITVSFRTTDGAQARALTISLGDLPPGWSASSSVFTCPIVGSGVSCSLTLTYAPTSPQTGTLDLTFPYTANNGATKTGAVTIQYSSALPTLKLLAGAIGGSGNLDGSGSTARFQEPRGIAVGVDGTLYVADSSNSTIRRITPAGIVSTMAGRAGTSGSDNGPGSTARFHLPIGAAVDRAGTVYIADNLNYAIRRITADGAVTTFAGGTFGSEDGTGLAAQFAGPTGIGIDAAGNLYVTDPGNATVRKITPQGVVTTLAGASYDVVVEGCLSVDGIGATARFCQPLGVAVDSAGIVYVADSGNQVIRKISADGVVSTLAGTPNVLGSADGMGGAASFNYPSGIAVDDTGVVYVSDQGNNTIRTITPAGLVATLAGAAGIAGSKDGSGTGAEFDSPYGLTVDAARTVYVGDEGNSTIRSIRSDGLVTTLAGAAFASGSSDGAGSEARFFASKFGSGAPIPGPAGVTVANDGNTYVADTGNQTIRKVSPDGTVTTLAGSPSPPPGSSSGCRFSDGAGSVAQFCVPQGVAVDLVGAVYVADTGNSVVRKITPQGDVTTLAGSPGIAGGTDGVGSTARFGAPQSIAIDTAGTLYVFDGIWIRSISPKGVVTTIAGSLPPPCTLPGTTCLDICPMADGVGPAALFCRPTAIAIDGAGLIYVADRSAVRKVTPAGVVTTIDTAAYYSGSTTPGLVNITGIAVDDHGSIYVADGFRRQIFLVSPDGALTPMIGADGSAGIFLGALPASLMYPTALAVGAGGQFFIADGGAILFTNGL
jgi:sugar lactone lactonase YvrE